VITQDLLEDIFDTTGSSVLARYVGPMQMLLQQYSINTPKRVAMFLSQVGQESAGLRVTEENLNYSAAGLRAVFPTHFPNHDEAAYARQPEKIANRVYASRLGNGNEASGDGWRYRGRGLIQITGKTNYTAFATFTNKSLEDATSYLSAVDGAVHSAVWYWNKNNLNRFADAGDEVGCTKAVNGGLNGLAQRTQYYHDALDALT